MWIKGLDAIGPGGHQEICRPGKGGEKGSGSENGGRQNNRWLDKKIGFEERCFHKGGRRKNHFTVIDSILRGELRPLRVPDAPEELLGRLGLSVRFGSNDSGTPHKKVPQDPMLNESAAGLALEPGR